MVKNSIRFLISGFLGTFIALNSYAEIIRIGSEDNITYRDTEANIEASHNKDTNDYIALRKTQKGYTISIPKERAKDIFEALKVRYEEQQKQQ